MVVPERASHWDYFKNLGSFEDKHKFNYAVKLYLLFVDQKSEEGTREYILSRVIQALGAMSNSMRAGAYSLFCTLLTNCPQQCDFETVNKIIQNHLKTSGTVKADAEAFVGQLLAYKAIVHSKLLDQTPRQYTVVADGLMDLGLKKSYLYAEVLSILGNISVSTNQEFGSDVFLQKLKDLSTSPLDKLNYLLKLEKNFENSETIDHVFDGRKLLSVETASEIGVILSKSHNRSHPFLDALFDEIAGNYKYVKAMWKGFEKNVKDKVGTSKAVYEMYCTILSGLFKRIQEKKKFKIVKTLVGDVTVEALVAQGKNKLEVTKETCKWISDVVNSAGDSDLSMEILNRLVFSPGSLTFDEDTGSKVVGNILRSLDEEGTKQFGDKCLSAVVEGDGMKNKERFSALNIFCNLLNKPPSQIDNKWRVDGMKSLLKAGLVQNDHVSYDLAVEIRKCFFNLLSNKFPSLVAYVDALKQLVSVVESCMNKSKSLRIKVNDDMKESWGLSQKLMASLEKHKKKAKGGNLAVIQALELLTCFIALKSMNEPKESQLNLSDMQSVFKKITKSGESSADLEWIEVVMDLFLNMLSKPNVSNRNVINIVFKIMVPHLNDGAFTQLVEVLEPNFDLNKGDEDEGEEGDDEEEDGDDESEDSVEEEEEDEDKESSEEEDDDEELEDDENTNSRAFNQEKLQFDLRKALMPANDSDNESINLEDMDEEEGRQLDARLSAIFKNAQVKKKNTKRQSNTSHFRTRVLDLLETYCTAGMPLDHWLTFIPIVIKLADSVVATKNAAGVRQRVLSFVKKLSSYKISDIDSEECEVENLVELIRQLIEDSSKSSGTALDLKQHYLEFVKFLTRNLNHVPPARLSPLTEQINAAVQLAADNFFSEKGNLPLNLMIFLCQYNWCGVHQMASQVVEKTFAPNTKQFKQFQGLSLLSTYFKSERTFSSISEEDVKKVKKIAANLLESMVGSKGEADLDVRTQQLVTSMVVDIHNSKAASHIKWKKWKEQLPQLLNAPSGKKSLKSFENLCKKLGLNSTDFPATTGTATKKQKKQQNQKQTNDRKRKKVDVRKLKKESKRLRLAAMDGLDNFSWSTLVEN